jgi:hypothetical protein
LRRLAELPVWRAVSNRSRVWNARRRDSPPFHRSQAAPEATRSKTTSPAVAQVFHRISRSDFGADFVNYRGERQDENCENWRRACTTGTTGPRDYGTWGGGRGQGSEGRGQKPTESAERKETGRRATGLPIYRRWLERNNRTASNGLALRFRRQLGSLVFLVAVPQGGQQFVAGQRLAGNHLIDQEVEPAQTVVQGVRLCTLQFKLRLEDGLKFLTACHRRPPGE